MSMLVERECLERPVQAPTPLCMYGRTMGQVLEAVVHTSKIHGERDACSARKKQDLGWRQALVAHCAWPRR